MGNPISKPVGRTLAEFGALSLAEQKLLYAYRKGDIARISEHRPEEENNIENTVRGGFLRFLALGGDEQVSANGKGVFLQGAWVQDDLDLGGATLPDSIALINCHLNAQPVMSYSNIHGFVKFQGCYIKGLKAEQMICTGSVFLNDKFNSVDTVNLVGAQIGGNLECDNGIFDVKDNVALVFDRALIKGGVFFRTGFIANGIVRLLGSHIDGNFECSGAMLNDTRSRTEPQRALICENAVIKGGVFLNDGFTANGTVFLSGAKIGGELTFAGATLNGTAGTALKALVAEGITVAGTFFFRGLRSIKGDITLVSAQVGSLCDDDNSWSGKLDLDGFVYDRLIGNAPTEAKSRLAWLDKQLDKHAGLAGDGKDFKPQPWRQLQKVLGDMGHVEDARQVAIAFEDRLRRANLIGQTPKNWFKPRAWLARKVSRSFHWLFGCFIGYGYRPLRMLYIMLTVWLVCGMFYWYAALHGVFAPSNPLVFQNSVYEVCVPGSDAAKAERAKPAGAVPLPIQGAGNWYLCEKLREEYTGFSPLAYSLDLILPLVDLQQERDWAPMIPTPKNIWTDELLTWSAIKHCTRFLMWFEILFGWMTSLLLVAVVSGLTKQQDE
ncbi:MAG: hypothetical protein LUQ11_06905 [Methylococcaceae bacterium]|nr:hypothetical protein [Methylococcaceae bacterium]